MLKASARKSPDINYLDYVEVVNAIEDAGRRTSSRSANFPATRTMNLSDAYKRLNAHVLFPVKEGLLS